MDISWLVNFSMAFDGSRFLSEDDEAPRILEVPFSLTIDASQIAGSRDSMVDGFLALARSSAIEGLELLCSDAVGLGLPAWETDPELNEFVLVTRDQSIAWQLRSRSKHWIADTSNQFHHEWSYHFENVQIPRAPQLDAPEAADRLRQLLVPHTDDPWLNGAVGEALSILDGGELPEPGSVVPWGVNELRQRLYYAASTVAGGKLQGMGGFADFVSVDLSELIYAFTQAFAASTRPGG